MALPAWAYSTEVVDALNVRIEEAFLVDYAKKTGQKVEDLRGPK